MRERMPGLAACLIATIFLVFPLILMQLAGSDGIIFDLAVLAVVGSLISLWLVWAIKLIESNAASADAQVSQEKAKRGTSEDTRLSLLLELMDEEERQALKRRLLDDLGGDGENVSLAALLSAQNDKRSSS